MYMFELTLQCRDQEVVEAVIAKLDTIPEMWGTRAEVSPGPDFEWDDESEDD
jgi:hypothetical protein